MSRFEMEFEIQGLKLRIKGNRDEIPNILQNLSQQVGGILEPAAQIVSGEEPRRRVPNAAEAPIIEAKPTAAKGKKRRRGATPGDAPNTGPEVLDWMHDPAKWGNPAQSWTTLQKALWLLNVAHHECGRAGLSGPSIAATFNKHFRQSRTIHPPNVTRDLGAAKTKSNAFVGEDTTKRPSEWFLTQAGITEANRLVQSAMGQANPEEPSLQYS